MRSRNGFISLFPEILREACRHPGTNTLARRFLRGRFHLLPVGGPRIAGRRAWKGSAQMLDQRINRTCLSPHDMAICERVFDRVCADEHIDPLGLEATLVASMVVGIFRNAHTSERELLEAVRFRRQQATARARLST
ncbi:hypothetical protein [Mesorhizobium sp. LjNodule214]|uniref:hypothetical protein n=1 Tax=Mesorhizobium sp. LjNodule214 TaxID=3342252 RepID=UPI003ECC449D